MSDLREYIIKNFNKNIINLNGQEYISVDMFQSAVSELAVMESLFGTLILRLNEDITIKEEEAIEYIVKYNEMIDMKLIDGHYVIKINRET